MKFALVKNGQVKNIIVADEAFAQRISRDWEAVVPIKDVHPDIGWGWDADRFVEPEKPVEPEDPRVKRKAEILEKISQLGAVPQREILLGIMELL